MVLTLVTFRASQLEEDRLALTETEAEQRRDDLARTVEKLCAQLGQVRAAVVKAA